MCMYAGIAHYCPPPVMWSAHPSFGIWFAFRAVIVFSTIKVKDIPGEGTAAEEFILPPVDIQTPPEVS